MLLQETKDGEPAVSPWRASYESQLYRDVTVRNRAASNVSGRRNQKVANMTTAEGRQEPRYCVKQSVVWNNVSGNLKILNSPRHPSLCSTRTVTNVRNPLRRLPVPRMVCLYLLRVRHTPLVSRGSLAISPNFHHRDEI
jgi:hypothetical protein